MAPRRSAGCTSTMRDDATCHEICRSATTSGSCAMQRCAPSIAPASTSCKPGSRAARCGEATCRATDGSSKCSTHGTPGFTRDATAAEDLTQDCVARALSRDGDARAVLLGRDHVLPSDVHAVAPHVLAHRLLISSRELTRGTTPADVIDSVLRSVPVPPVVAAP